MGRFIKRLVIIAIFVLLVIGLVVIILLSKKEKATCSDGKRNQGEEQIDCGGPCNPCQKNVTGEEISIQEKTFIYGGQGKYDLMAKIYNPNEKLGSPGFKYEFILRDVTGAELAKKTGSSFILPSETKYVLAVGMESNQIAANVDFRIYDASWVEFYGYEKPQLGIYSKHYNLISSGVGYSEALGIVRNESPYDFNVIGINIVLKDSAGKAVALNQTEIRTVSSNEEREFRLIWPTSFPGDVTQVEMGAEVNVFDSQNFVNKYLDSKKFQDLR